MYVLCLCVFFADVRHFHSAATRYLHAFFGSAKREPKICPMLSLHHLHFQPLSWLSPNSFRFSAMH